MAPAAISHAERSVAICHSGALCGFLRFMSFSFLVVTCWSIFCFYFGRLECGCAASGVPALRAGASLPGAELPLRRRLRDLAGLVRDLLHRRAELLAAAGRGCLRRGAPHRGFWDLERQALGPWRLGCRRRPCAWAASRRRRAAARCGCSGFRGNVPDAAASLAGSRAQCFAER